jgi:hypothetical protein
LNFLGGPKKGGQRKEEEKEEEKEDDRMDGLTEEEGRPQIDDGRKDSADCA